MNNIRVSRWVRGYEVVQGELKVEYRLPDSVPVQKLRELFKVMDENPMYDAYPIGPAHAAELGRFLGSELTDGDLEFFLEADTES
jgi:hypothetical protein